MTLMAMVEESLGITLLPQIAIDAGITSGHAIALTPLKGASPRRVILAWRQTSAHGEDFKSLAKIFRSARHG